VAQGLAPPVQTRTVVAWIAPVIGAAREDRHRCEVSLSK
jgi:hypothetical protein